MKKIHFLKKNILRFFFFILITILFLSFKFEFSKATIGNAFKPISNIIQESIFTLIKSIPTKSSIINSDNLGNIYLIKESSIEKYTSEGIFINNYSNKSFGNITSIDVSNPLKILVFYEAFQKVILLDNTLTPTTSSISIESLGYNQVSMVCNSHNNGIWMYNKQNSELIFFDQNFKEINKTENIALRYQNHFNPSFLIEQNNQIFLNDSSTGILIFDTYGTYFKKISIQGINHFQINGDQLVFTKKNALKSYNIKTFEEEEFMLPTTQIIDARTEKEKLYLLKQNSLEIYNVKKNKN